MTQDVHPHAATARSLLFSAADDGTTLTRLLDDHGIVGTLGQALRNLSHEGQQVAAEQIAVVTAGLLELDLDNLLLAGWRKHADLVAAARRTLAAPGSREVVQLATHVINSTHRPSVDVLLERAHVGTVHLELSITFKIEAVTGVVGNGRLLALAAGQCTATGALAAEGRVLLTRSGQFDLPGLVRLGGGVALVDPAPTGVPAS